MKYQYEQRVKTSKGEGIIIAVLTGINGNEKDEDLMYAVDLDTPYIPEYPELLDECLRGKPTTFYALTKEELDQYNQKPTNQKN